MAEANMAKHHVNQLRTGAEAEFPEMWAVMCARVDEVMGECFEAMVCI